MAISIVAMKPKHTTTTNNNVANHHTVTDESSTGSNSPSPPPSPPPPPRHSSISRRRLRVRTKPHSQSRPENLAVGFLFRRNLRYLLVLPLLYISGLLICVGPFSGLVGLFSPPGSVYRSHQIFEKLWDDIRDDNATAIQLSSVWKHKRRITIKPQKPCPDTTTGQNFGLDKEASGPSGYLIVEANGGLNQQRSAICNAVAVAGLLNAILVIPRFEFNNVWRDPSEFGDIYDENHFITTLEDFVKVVSELPLELMERYDYNVTNVPNFRVPAWAPANYYLGEVYPVLKKEGVIRIAPFANRLAMRVPPHIQFLRCIANFKALKFSSSIAMLAQNIINRMIEKSSRTDGKYVSVHLRFEEDMVAFSCCVYDRGEAEKSEMDSLRKKGWKGKFKRKDYIIKPGFNRINGKCPLTPLEVGLMLRGMGFDNNTSIYLASGKIYQAEKYLAPLLKMFPLLYTKESLTTPDELAPFEWYSSRLAALDYTVCLFSEVFVTTQGGNFPHFLMGHRRFLFYGHSKSINPDKRKLVLLLQDMGISWKAFKDQMREMLIESDRKGMVIPRVRKINRKTSIYTYPLPECSCLQQTHNSTLTLANDSHIVDSQLYSTK
ncbi:O-FucT domain-containing protein [Cephalotus follicularis]|uniref:O-fucosyltransferase family protein n=1 Tax=Cephalotus follicularis TaxID=3775 RepID=A0A1Q3C811_CEPFO|nr:O-FucT domain-containing protein [Cephalotus follicularis]